VLQTENNKETCICLYLMMIKCQILMYSCICVVAVSFISISLLCQNESVASNSAVFITVCSISCNWKVVDDVSVSEITYIVDFCYRKLIKCHNM